MCSKFNSSKSYYDEIISKFNLSKSYIDEIIPIIEMILSKINLNIPIYFAMDISGSVKGNIVYHCLCYALHIKFNSIKTIPFIINILWNNKYHIVSTQYLYEYILIPKYGNNGTLTSSIAMGILSNMPKQPINLVIITDGEVDINDINIADALMNKDLLSKGLKIDTMSGIIIRPSNVLCNASVLSPYCRDCSFSIYHIKEGNYTNCHKYDFHKPSMTIVMTMDDVERIDILHQLDTISTIDELKIIYERLITLLTSKTMGISNPSSDPILIELRSKILLMAKRIKITASKIHNSSLVSFSDSLTTNNTASIEQMTNVFTSYYTTFAGDDLQHYIDNILSILDGKFSTTFDFATIRTAMLKRSAVAIKDVIPVDIQLTEVDMTATVATCPITLESENIMVILLNIIKPIFHQLDKGLQDAIKCNPFMILIPQVLDIIKKCIDHAISVASCNVMMVNGIVRSPLTRNECNAFLVIGDDKQSIMAANTALAKMITGTKEIYGNVDIWFYAIYHLIITNQIPWLDDLKIMMRNQMIKRLTRPNTTTLSFSGLPIYVQLRSNLADACYYNIHQPFLKIENKYSSLQINWISIKYMINLLELANYHTPYLDVIKKYYVILRLLSYLINDVKKLHLKTFQIKYNSLIMQTTTFADSDYTPVFLQNAKISNFVCNWVTFDGILSSIPIIMDEFANFQLDGYPIITSSLVYNLSKLITKESITLWDIAPNISVLDDYYTQIELVNVINWPLASGIDFSPKLCPKTMRPYTYFGDGSHWTHKYCNTFNQDQRIMANSTIFDADGKSLRPVFAGYQYYIDFVCKYGYYPTLADFSTYVFNSMMNGQYNYMTLPKLSWLVNIIKNYSHINSTISPTIFNDIANKSRNRIIRITMEI